MNPFKGEASLKLSDGRDFTLVLDFEALVAAEVAYGKPLAKVMSDAAAGFVGAIRAILFGALHAKHPDITMADVAEFVLTDLDAIGEALSRATDASFPPAKEDRETSGPRRGGRSSGRNGVKRG